MDNNSLRERLRRLGVRQGREGLTAPPPPDARAGERWAIEQLVPGREVPAGGGAYFVAEAVYPLSHRHGARALGDLLAADPRVAARLSQAEALAEGPLADLAFFDIETTGLAGGAGTLAFLIGVGVIDAAAGEFRLQQFFLRDPAEEPALLHGVHAALEACSGLVTYNGRTFDVPIMQTRFILARRSFDLRSYPNLDLLPAARRLWRGRYENCSLGTLESAVLGLRRSEADVPGALIPQLYVDYLRTGDARQMQRVIYHNAEDILSMVALAVHILETFADPLSAKRPALDSLRLAMWHDDRGETGEAEAAYRTALGRKLPADQKPVLYARFAGLLKRLDRRAEALPLWEKWADQAESDPTPCLEISKYYEWEAKDMAEARAWAARAMLSATHLRGGWQRDQIWADIQHRLERLARKEQQG
jgi:uncharacterized protein YprB with RNaseH-like and TPR domain